jgi:hypothetical protein
MAEVTWEMAPPLVLLPPFLIMSLLSVRMAPPDTRKCGTVPFVRRKGMGDVMMSTTSGPWMVRLVLAPDTTRVPGRTIELPIMRMMVVWSVALCTASMRALASPTSVIQTAWEGIRAITRPTNSSNHPGGGRAIDLPVQDEIKREGQRKNLAPCTVRIEFSKSTSSFSHRPARGGDY